MTFIDHVAFDRTFGDFILKTNLFIFAVVLFVLRTASLLRALRCLKKVGTAAFMAPETFTGEEFSGIVVSFRLLLFFCTKNDNNSDFFADGGTHKGKRTDIWALGVTLYMLAIGKLPWEVSMYVKVLVAKQMNRRHSLQ